MTENNAAQPGLKDTIRSVFLAHGFTVKDGHTDLKPYVYEAVYALLSKLRAEGVQAGDERAFQLIQDLHAFAANQRWFGKHGYESVGASRRLEISNDIFARLSAALASAPASEDGLTAKQAWWAGYRAGKGLPPDTPRQDAVKVDISSARLVTHWPNGTPRDERDTASDPEGKLIHDPTEPLLAASAPVAGEADQPDIDTLRRIGAAHDARHAASQASEAVRLDAPAQVGGVRFGKGIHWSTVIAAAQRHHAFMNTPEKEAERIARAKEFVESIQSDKDGGDCAPHNSDSRYAVESSTCGDCAKGAVIDLEAAAKALSECMDYPWAQMPEKGRAHMREHAQTVINAALAAQHPRTDGGGRE